MVHADSQWLNVAVNNRDNNYLLSGYCHEGIANHPKFLSLEGNHVMTQGMPWTFPICVNSERVFLVSPMSKALAYKFDSMVYEQDLAWSVIHEKIHKSNLSLVQMALCIDDRHPQVSPGSFLSRVAGRLVFVFQKYFQLPGITSHH